MEKTILNHNDVMHLAEMLGQVIFKHFPHPVLKAYAVPRGGIPAAYATAVCAAPHQEIQIVLNPLDADIFIDDIIDSGETMQKFCDQYPGIPFYALINKLNPDCEFKDDWVVFPWEAQDKSEDDSIVGTITNRIKSAGAPFFANDNVAEFIKEGELSVLQAELEKRYRHFLQGLLIDIDNDHNTMDTAKRVAKMALKEVFKGRYVPAPDITDFPNAKKLDEMYLTGPITVRSACSHHFVPIVGKCWIGIIPGDELFGLSKFNRIVDWIASRPQIQEEMIVQIADFIEKQVKPKGVAVVIKASHLCMTWRGVKEPMEAQMTNSIMRGVFRDKPEARAEFLALIGK